MATRRTTVAETKEATVTQPTRTPARMLLEQYECGPVAFSGTPDASYERQLVFDHVVRPEQCRPAPAFRGRGLGASRLAVAALAEDRRDLRSSQPQASLLPLDGVPDRPVAGQQHPQPAGRTGRQGGDGAREARLGASSPRWSPTPAWATAAWAGSPPASSTRWRRFSSPRSATACGTSTGSSARRSTEAGRSSTPTTGSAVPTPGRSSGRERPWRSG